MTPPNGDEHHKWNDRETADPYSAREGLTWYKQLGYVPNDRTARAASATLEGTCVSFKLHNGKTFIIEAANNSDSNLYIQSATLNGKPLDAPTISWVQIQAGGTLHFRNGERPLKTGVPPGPREQHHESIVKGKRMIIQLAFCRSRLSG